MKRSYLLIFVLFLFSSVNTLAETAIFAGGCFWCTEADFEKLDGVEEAVSGYIGGHIENPTYKQVTKQDTGHYEAAKITYNPDKISYKELLDHYWLTIDPFDNKGQFCDKGDSYRSAIFTSGDQQYALATASKKALQAKFPEEQIATEIIRDKLFYPAENYHQNYYKNNSLRYKYYRWNCGRDQRLKNIWGDKIENPSKPL